MCVNVAHTSSDGGREEFYVGNVDVLPSAGEETDGVEDDRQTAIRVERLQIVCSHTSDRKRECTVANDEDDVLLAFPTYPE